MLTDASAVYADWGKPTQRQIRRATPEALKAMPFAAGSMGPKVEAACRFATASGKTAAIGQGRRTTKGTCLLHSRLTETAP